MAYQCLFNFNFHLQLFVALDLLKLTLLSAAIASPFLVVNTVLTFLLSYPKDDELKWSNNFEQLLSGTVFISIAVTLFILSIGAAAALIECSAPTVKLIIAGTELTFMITVICSKLIEDKRFKLAESAHQENNS